MRKPFLAEVYLGLLLLVAVTSSANQDLGEVQVTQDGSETWLESANQLLHRVKRQFNFGSLFFPKSTTTPPPDTTTESGVIMSKEELSTGDSEELISSEEESTTEMFQSTTSEDSEEEEETTPEDVTTTKPTTKKRGGLFGGLFGSGLFGGKDETTTETTPEITTEAFVTWVTHPIRTDDSTPPGRMQTDDEDFGSSGSGEESLGGHVGWSTNANKPRYYRISMMVIEPYNSDFDNLNSAASRLFSETLTQNINLLYEDVTGFQSSRVIKIQQVDPFKIRVFLDLQTVGNHNTNEIKQRLIGKIENNHKIGDMIVESDILFNEFGACSAGEISCKDGAQCILQSARCDERVDCADASDEDGCETFVKSVDQETRGPTREEHEDRQEVVEESEEDEDEVRGRTSFTRDRHNGTGIFSIFGLEDPEKEKQQGQEFDRTLSAYDKWESSGEGRGNWSGWKDRVSGEDDGVEGRVEFGSETGDREGSEERRVSVEEDISRGLGYGVDTGSRGDGYDEETRSRGRHEDTGSRGSGYDEETGSRGRHEDTGSRGSAYEEESRSRGGAYEEESRSRGGAYDEESRSRGGAYDEESRSRGRHEDTGSRGGGYDEDTESRGVHEVGRSSPGYRGETGRDACRADDKVRCASDYSIFICSDQECDGHPDCPGASDEENCDETFECGQGEFMCDRTRCIMASAICDGRKDCQDGTDEAECPDQGCDFRCRDGTCLSYHQRCNIIKDCADGDDELDCHGNVTGSGCPPGDFACRNGGCISESYRCDSIPDCTDNSDEDDCSGQVGPVLTTPSSGPGPSKPCDGFTCDDGSCVETDHRCDGKIDCNDGTDERECRDIPRPTAPICVPGQTQCRDGKGCYFYNQTCDGRYECTDGSDETDCDCKADQFKCRSGQCISQSLVCDQYSDCEDGEDEENCRTSTECGSGEFRCDDGKCINEHVRCDGYRDCEAGEDEINCRKGEEETPCLPAEFRCRNSECIRNDFRCDGIIDCSDSSDEENCPVTCGPRDHKCANGTCIKESKVCDSYVDCPDGSDEENCNVDCSWTEVKCDSGECIPNINRCDGRVDCQDGSDEVDCPSSVHCASFQYKCESGDQCIHRNLVCDDKPDCRDGSDEFRCFHRNDSLTSRCTSFEFKCLSGNQCIDKSQFCDGQVDCNDRSDEENCDAGPSLDLKTYPSEQTIKESREVVFQCRDEGPGHIPVRWSRGDGLPLPPNSRDYRGRLEMPNIQQAHSGTYNCEAVGVPRNNPRAKVSVYLKVEPFTVPTPYTPVCRQDQATCHNRECIPKNKVCDGHHDCGDGSDESRCSPFGCEPNEFACDNRKCVRKSWVCDKDDDCGDGSDERDCQQKPSGSLCYINEFECADRKMCIPKWFHCDSHNDCHDGSDEIGCYPIKIVNVSKTMIMVPQGESLKITCQASGVPTPVISWRLNWHHVPSKCRSTSERGFGTLTCPDMQENDQGAYTCEALDFRNSILAPDTHVIVKPSTPTQCPRGMFNSQATRSDDCIPCFCFGATSDCHSSDQLYLHTMRPSMTVARFINVRYDPYRRTVEVRTSDPSIIPQTALRVSPDNVVQIVTPVSLGRRYDQIYPYLALPETLHGNQLNSYGGSLQYTVAFGGSPSQFIRTTNPDLILIGNGYTLSYNVTDRLIPQTENEISIKFVPGNWQVVEKLRSGGSDRGYATRQDLMMTLQNVENILVNFQYLEGEQAETTISNIRMDTARVRSTERGIASAVEQCRCPAGYTGQSCESCAPDYMRTRDGLWLGRCERYVPRKCPPGTYGDPARRIPCKPCPCPMTTPSNQFARSCRLDSNDEVICDCPAAYAGNRCDRCAPGYTGNPLEPSGYCRPVEQEQCDPAGSYSPYPDPSTGVCDCKAHTTGERCDQCKPDTFAFSGRHQHGCIDCFCMGITEECSSSNLYRDQIQAVFSSGTHGFTIAPSEDFRNARNVSFDSSKWEIVYNNLEPKVFYWVVPSRFLGDKVTSYGGALKYTLRYIPTPGGQSSKNNAPDVEIRSLNNINLVHSSSTPPEPGVESTITVPMLEQHWTREDGGPVDRPHLLMALADLSAIYIKATYTTNTLEAALMSVSLDTAGSRLTGGTRSRAVEVEQCRCPQGYIGTSCEDCDAGYTRTEDGLYLRFCEPCSCNNHSTQCHPETGICENCDDNTAGKHCEDCLHGFTKGPDGRCSYADMTCDCDRRGGVCRDGRNCQCKTNVEGRRCDNCRLGTFGLTESRPEGCFQCYCSGVSSQCQSSNLYREKIPTLVIDHDHGFTIFATPYSETTSLRGGNVISDDFTLDYRKNEIGYNVLRRPNQRYFWSLPSQLTGDQITSYGGKLSFKLRYEGVQDVIVLEPDTNVILVGNGISLFTHFNEEVIRAGHPKVFEVDLIDNGQWKIMNPITSTMTASRIDMLKTLASLEKILVLATFGDGIELTHISDVAMDTAVPARLGKEASEVEVCRCPREYKGTSCQMCNDHHYRHYDESCRPCPCNDHDESCSLGPNNQIRCNCRRGYYGDNCEHTGYPDPSTIPDSTEKPTIVITITEPYIKIVEVGQTVVYNCSAISILTGRPLTTIWSKESGSLPSRAIKEYGALIITGVQESDSGIYTCTANDGYKSLTKSVSLVVGDDRTGVEPTVRISPDYVNAKVGESLELICEATGSPRASLTWSRQDGSLINPDGLLSEGTLRIYSLRPEDQGIYECEASNRYGRDSSTVEVIIREPDPDRILSISPWKFSGLEGDTVYVTCSTTNSHYRLSWSRQGGRALPSMSRELNGTLSIFGARAVDQGIYICTAHEIPTGRKVAESQISIEIGVNRLPAPTVVIEPDKQTVPQGTSATIRCSTAQPGVRVRWSKREDTIPTYVQIQGGTLRIPAVRVTDRGMYICTVEYGTGQLQKYAILEVEPREAPTIELYPRTQQTLVQGASMLFQCRASGIPPPNVYWSRPGNQSIPYNIQQLPNGVLRLNNVQVSDAGQYVCHAENTAGSTTATANIEVHSIPSVRISPRGPVHLQAGQVLKLECNASGYPQPYVSWSRHRTSPSRFSGYGFEGSNDLTEPSYNHAVYEAYSISEEDEGVYLCNARNDAGTTEERVEVIISDNSIRPGGDYDDRETTTTNVDDEFITIMGGESMHITCTLASNQNDRVRVEWVRADGRSLPDGSHQRDGVLYLNNVGKDTEGVYTCMLTDRDSRAILQQKQTTVSVNYPPRITLTPQRQVVRVGDNARIQCSAHGEQPITITWEAVDRPMPSSVSSQQGYLLFQGIRISDAGRYVCRARNVIAESSSVAEVIVNEETTSRPIVTAIDRRPTVLEGGKVELQCSADATFQMRWTREGGINCCDLPPQAIISGNSLILEYANPEDSGRYRCTGISPSGMSSSDFIDLTVNKRNLAWWIFDHRCRSDQFKCTSDGSCIPQYRLCDGRPDCNDSSDESIAICGNARFNRGAQNIKLSIQPSIDVIQVGDTFDLKCIPSGVPNPQLSWTKVGDRLANNVQVLENILRISDVTTRNNGIYRCSARTSTGHYERDYILDVQGNDEYDRPSTNGDDRTNGYDNGDDDRYGGDDNNVDNNDNNGYDNNNNGDDRDDNNYNGNDNDNGYENGDDNNTDNGYDDGDDDKYPNNGDDENDPYDRPALEVKTADAGKTIHLTCKTDLEPPVTYSWSRLGQELQANAYDNQSSLIISNLGEKDSGVYMCVASNGPVRMEIPQIVTVSGLIPSFHQNPISYVAMPMLLDAHLNFDIEITFKPEQPDGLILYNGQSVKDGDFIAFGLKSGRPEFRFEVGSGPAVITTSRPIRLNQWHTVKLSRSKREGQMWVDGGEAHTGTSPGRYQGLDLDEPMYLGSVPEFDKINPMNGFSSGFVGCISELKLRGVKKPISREFALQWEGVGDCDTCRDHACENGGACQQAHNRRGYVCICPRGFSDDNCTKLGESCFPGVCGTGECVEADRGIRCKCPIDKTGDRCEKHNIIKVPNFSSNSYIAYQLLKAQQKLKMTVLFKAADDSDGVLLYSSPEGTSHFVSLAIKNNHLEFLYDNGYGLSQVRSSQPVSPGEWEQVTIGADEREVYLNFHGNNRNSVTSRPGIQRSVVGSLLYLGGVDQSVRLHPSVGVRKGFNGCISSIDVHGLNLNVVWSAKEASGITECPVRDPSSSITCRPNTCKNNGACSVKNNRVTCSCRPGFSGPYCETVEDECITSSPCKNGGTCEKSSSGTVQCLCPPGIAGSVCEDRLDNDVSFDGNGYLELDTELMQHDDPSEVEVIEIDFTTTSPEGLLLWQGQLPGNREESDFLAIAVVEGEVEVSYELGSGPARIRLRDVRVDDGAKHRLVVTRTASDAEVELDGTHEATGSSEGLLSKLNTPGNIFIGGAPDIGETTLGKYDQGFSGCIHKLRLPYKGEIDFQVQPLRSLNSLPCSNDYNDIGEGRYRGFYDIF